MEVELLCLEERILELADISVMREKELEKSRDPNCSGYKLHCKATDDHARKQIIFLSSGAQRNV